MLPHVKSFIHACRVRLFNSAFIFHFCIAALALFPLALLFYLHAFFGDVSFEQLIYHLNNFGINVAEIALVRAAALAFTLLLATAFLLACGMHWRLSLKNSLLLHFLIFVTTGGIVLYQMKAIDSFALKGGEDFIAKHYIDPGSVKVTHKGEPRNLILLYVEGLENTYSDKHLFSASLTPNLDELESSNLGIPDFKQVHGTQWTIAGIFSSMCGIPLKPVGLFRGNKNPRRASIGFARNAICLGDILSEQNYTLQFMGGAELKYSGKGNFLTSHGFDQVDGKNEFLRDGEVEESELNNWGLYDDNLLDLGIDRARTLLDKKRPFALTLLTLDTHHPNGHMSPSCERMGLDPSDFEDVIRCTDILVSDFVKRARDLPNSDHTDIVLMGDHLPHKNQVYEIISQNKSRRIRNIWIKGESDSGAFKSSANEANHFDMLPSLLEFMEFKLEGKRMGLGHSIFETTGETAEHIDTISEKGDALTVRNLNAHLPSHSSFYNSLW